MSKVFDAYAEYYDLLYSDKDYAGEANYIHGLIQQFSPKAKSILELGSGTGKHAALLAEKSYTIHGVERSDMMLAQAAALSAKDSRLSFSSGDLRETRVGKRFDVVMSLFHVISYQTSNRDLKAAFATVKEHLNPGGIFVFDCWYGPAVLTERPSVRVKRVSNNVIDVTRLVEPTLYPNENRVEVKYQVFIRNKKTDQVQEVRETHQMRYLFAPEIDSILEQVGCRVVSAQEWMTGKTPGCNTWGVCFIGQLV